MHRCRVRVARVTTSRKAAHGGSRPAHPRCSAVCMAVYVGISARLDAPEPRSAEGSMPWMHMLRGNAGALRMDRAPLSKTSPYAGWQVKLQGARRW